MNYFTNEYKCIVYTNTLTIKVVMIIVIDLPLTNFLLLN